MLGFLSQVPLPAPTAMETAAFQVLAEYLKQLQSKKHALSDTVDGIPLTVTSVVQDGKTMSNWT